MSRTRRVTLVTNGCHFARRQQFGLHHHHQRDRMAPRAGARYHRQPAASQAGPSQSQAPRGTQRGGRRNVVEDEEDEEEEAEDEEAMDVDAGQTGDDLDTVRPLVSMRM